MADDDVWNIETYNLIIVLLYIERSKKSHVFASSLTASKTKRANKKIDMITLRNHAPRSYMTWLSVTLSVLDMIIVYKMLKLLWALRLVSLSSL